MSFQTMEESFIITLIEVKLKKKIGGLKGMGCKDHKRGRSGQLHVVIFISCCFFNSLLNNGEVYIDVEKKE